MNKRTKNDVRFEEPAAETGHKAEAEDFCAGRRRIVCRAVKERGSCDNAEEP